ncbi:MAG: DUF262 domain-containing protein [Kofleriaceae bacterium]|jgi:hypothetical protein|nr:DUF262 domain-containing protein [Kofleriaceae bacterium]MBP9171150.1 DUF262 domain-containing protein [Kofleriaceae bacterium]MBP9861913.1 DUF262 domain-containing protein [Kofleriaceae bacterium]
MATRELVRRPDARTETVEDLVRRVLAGEVRIPAFQRPLQWQAADVVDLFDSVYRGYPIGSLLLRVAPGVAGPLRIGPLEVYGEETQRALWVVDGQQRLTSLAAGLARPARGPAPKDPFVVYFDPHTERFHAPPKVDEVPPGWVPVWRLFDAALLSEWVFSEWPDGRDPLARAAVFEAGKRLREYRVPYYVIETPDEEVAKHIFDRVNTKGKPLDRDDIFNALFGRATAAPATLSELGAELAGLGMGTPDEESQLLPGLVAMRGLDVTRPFKELAHEHPDQFTTAIADGAPVFRRVLGFLRVHAEVPHLRLLPFSTPLIVLCRFFALHAEPRPRTLILLVRWVWRSFLSPSVDDRTLRRRGVSAVEADEEASAQRLLALVESNRRDGFRLPDRFDARAADSRLVLLALAAHQPRVLAPRDDATLDVASALTAHDKDVFRPVFPGSGAAWSSPANRVLSVGVGSARSELVAEVTGSGRDTRLLRSHLIDPNAAAALIDNDPARFVAVRGAALVAAVDAMGARLAEWGHNDRPSIAYLLAEVGDP